MNKNRRNNTPAQNGAIDLENSIRELSFVLHEIQLYLDTHPDCQTALDYFYRTQTELKRLIEEYENTVGPLTARGVTNTDRWNWIDQPWPWQRPGDYMQPREEK